MKDIVIIGSGGIAVEVKYLIDDINATTEEWNFLGFIDSWGKNKGEIIAEEKAVIGSIEDLNAMKDEVYAVIAIGTPERIKDVALQIKNPNVKFANLIHPTAIVHRTAKIGYGNIITFTNFISCNTEIGNFNLFNTKCGIGHHVQIGSFNVFNPNTQISGNVKIGNENFFALNSSVLQELNIGNKNKIGAHSFVMRNIKDNGSYFGIPAKIMPLPVSKELESS
jgi:sugar O-acyltransferase (sialic acid O-acetyltransferase NeuD family)